MGRVYLVDSQLQIINSAIFSLSLQEYHSRYM